MIIVQNGFSCQVKKGYGIKKIIVLAANKNEAERIGRHYFQCNNTNGFSVKKQKLVIQDEQ
jgi:hypothetical protein